MLTAAADEVIVPSYEALVAAFDELADGARPAVHRAVDRASSKRLGTRGGRWRSPGGTPAPAASGRRWTDASRQPSPSRPGPTPSPTSSPGPTPSTRQGSTPTGAGVKGIVALEIGLFGDGSEELATPEGSRRCEYLMSVTALARAAAAEVLDDWTGGYRDEFVAGMDGDPQASLDALANEVIFRVTEIDDQGLRALTEATAADELQPTRADGPAAFRLAEHRATYESVAAVLDGRAAAGAGRRHQRRHRRAARRRRRGGSEAMAALPDSVTASFDDPDTVAAAQEAAMALKVLLSTEVASELGITLGFSDSDGDS